MKYLIDSAKCNPSQGDNDKATPLHSAAANGQLDAKVTNTRQTL